MAYSDPGRLVQTLQALVPINSHLPDLATFRRQALLIAPSGADILAFMHSVLIPCLTEEGTKCLATGASQWFPANF